MYHILWSLGGNKWSKELGMYSVLHFLLTTSGNSTKHLYQFYLSLTTISPSSGNYNFQWVLIILCWSMAHRNTVLHIPPEQKE